MNFARYECDRRKAQSLMRGGVFSLRVGKEIERNVWGLSRLGAVKSSNAGDRVRAVARLNRCACDAHTLSTPAKPFDDP
jgi:hypothetical protein